MDNRILRHHRLAKELAKLFDLESKIDAILSVSMYTINQYMDAERSSIFLFESSEQRLTVFSSLDLEKHEVDLPKSSGVAGWVFEHRKPAVVNNAYEDRRFYREVDDRTGFHTRNVICTPLVDHKNHCFGTLQSLNKHNDDFKTGDLELLDLAAQMLAVALNNSRRSNETRITDGLRRQLINQIVDGINDLSDKP